jgi:hypothetical protein
MGNRYGQFYGYTGLFPVRDVAPFQEVSPLDALRRHLNGLSAGSNSIFARTRLVHGARLFLIDDVIYNGHPSVSEHLAYPYLVLSMTFDGPLEGLADAIAGQAAEDFSSIFCNCYGFEGAGTSQNVLRYLQHCQVKTTFLYVDADGTLERTLRALKVQGMARDMVVRAQGASLSQRRAMVENLKAEMARIDSVTPGEFMTVGQQ